MLCLLLQLLGYKCPMRNRQMIASSCLCSEKEKVISKITLCNLPPKKYSSERAKIKEANGIVTVTQLVI